METSSGNRNQQPVLSAHDVFSDKRQARKGEVKGDTWDRSSVHAVDELEQGRSIRDFHRVLQ
jgi:hypothetical protein